MSFTAENSNVLNLSSGLSHSMPDCATYTGRDELMEDKELDSKLRDLDAALSMKRITPAVHEFLSHEAFLKCITWGDETREEYLTRAFCLYDDCMRLRNLKAENPSFF